MEHQLQNAHLRSDLYSVVFSKHRYLQLPPHEVLQFKPPDVSCQVILSCAYLHNICILHEVPVPDDVEEFMRAEPGNDDVKGVGTISIR